MQSISVNCNFRQSDTWTKYGEKITSGRERSYCETYMYYWSKDSRLAQQCYSVPQISTYADYIKLTSEKLVLSMETFANDFEISISVLDVPLPHLPPEFLDAVHGMPNGLEYLNALSKAKKLPETNLLNTNNQDVYCFGAWSSEVNWVKKNFTWHLAGTFGDELGLFPDYEYRKV